jgi:TolB protein
MFYFHSNLTSFRIIILCTLLILPACSPVPTPGPVTSLILTNTQTQHPPTFTEISTQTPYIITTTPETTVSTEIPQGIFFMSLEDGGSFHLFAYSPLTLPLTRLTSDMWDDITPAISPDGKFLAFSSRRNGYWDLYLLDLTDGKIQRMTDTPEYDGSPSWSPDGAYIAYETYLNGNMEVLIHSTLDFGQSPIPLSFGNSTNYSPSWSPQLPGRQIAFISNRSGEPDVWIADLDHAEKFTNISNNLKMAESHPVWSPDGKKLAWSALDPDTGIASLFVWDSFNPDNPIQWVGSGDWPVWQDNNNLASRLFTPNQSFLTSYSTKGTIGLPPIALPGALNGLSYGTTQAVLPGQFSNSNKITSSPTFVSEFLIEPNQPFGRSSLVELMNVTASIPQLSLPAGYSFVELRNKIIGLAGWDVLANLENAYVPITTPLDPGFSEDWLYTGRAFTLNPILIQADWMTIVREDFGQQTFWRMYVRTLAQDGSQGIPLTQNPWDFSARTTSSSAYENGGKLMDYIPGGYWLDLTTQASLYGWERLPAQPNWRTYYAGARFNELVFTQGLDWRSAMLQLYPPEVLVTPTIVFPPTRTATRTPLWYRSPTPSRTPTFFPTHTP